MVVPDEHPIHWVANLSPDKNAEEQAKLTEDIKLRGQMVPIIRWRGQIIDGRHRLAACLEAGVQPRFYDIAEDGDPGEVVLALTGLQRHMTDSQLAALAALLSQGSSRGRPRTEDEKSVNLRNISQGEAAEMLGISRSLVTHAHRVFSEESPAVNDLRRAVINGQISVTAASRVVKCSPEEQRRAVELVSTGKAKNIGAAIRQVRLEDALAEAAQPAGPVVTSFPGSTTTLHVSTIAGLHGLVEPGSLDAVIAHPPQGVDDLHICKELADFAAHALRSSGVMVVVGLGPMAMPMLQQLAHPDLNWIGEWCILFHGPAVTVSRPYPMLLRTRPVFVFGKLDYRPNANGNDLIEVPGPDPAAPEADRLELAMQLILERFVEPGLRICDPIMQNRPLTALAAWKAGCRFIGANPVESEVTGIRDRLAAAGSPGSEGGLDEDSAAPEEA